jgi:predicted chitinase
VAKWPGRGLISLTGKATWAKCSRMLRTRKHDVTGIATRAKCMVDLEAPLDRYRA